MFHYIVLNIIYICVCVIFVDIIICVLFVGREQSISCDNSLYGKHDFVLCRVSQKFVTIVLTFSLKIILRQFLSPFHKDYLTTNFNLTTS
jgi:hypothetical protein